MGCFHAFIQHHKTCFIHLLNINLWVFKYEFIVITLLFLIFCDNLKHSSDLSLQVSENGAQGSKKSEGDIGIKTVSQLGHYGYWNFTYQGVDNVRLL